jgi:hypothetical protein
VLNVATQRRPHRRRKQTPPSWDAPVYKVIRQVNHDALRWQIAQALNELTPSDWEAIRSDHEMESDAVIELYMQIYDRLTHPFRADIEFDCPLDQAFDAELRRQIAALLSAEVIAA